jgi:hydrogenase 3 maturation protease
VNPIRVPPTLPTLPDGRSSGRIAIVGIGNEMNADDGVGMEVVRALRRSVDGRAGLLMLETGTAPENFTGVLRHFHPDLVVLVDAADFDQQPGSIMWTDWQASDGFSGSTHTLPPSVLARFLAQSLGSRVILLGIQPATVEFGRPMSAATQAAIPHAVRMLEEWLTQN